MSGRNGNRIDVLFPITTLHDDSEMAGMVMHSELSTSERTVIEHYLRSNPELRKWFESEVVALGEDISSDANLVDGTMRRTGLLFRHIINAHDEWHRDRIAYRFMDMPDGVALAYAVECKAIASPSIKSNKTPSLNADEALYYVANSSTDSYDYYRPGVYLRILCARESDDSIYSDEVGRLSDLAFNLYRYSFRFGIRAIVWSDEDVLVKAACWYDHADMMMNILRITSYRGIHSPCQFIDSDYLNRVLLAPRPTPIEVGEDTWHDMAVQLANEIGRRREESNELEEYSYSDCVVPAFHCFITDDVNELTFIETIWDFFDSINDPYDGENLWLQEPIEPKIFDYLRAYGPTFTRQLLDLRFL